MGNLLAVVVHAANIHDTKSGILAARDAFRKYPSIQRFCADAGYRKTFEQDVSQELGLGVDIVTRTEPGGMFCPSGGLWSVLWPGSTIPVVFPKITRYLSILLKLFVSLLLSALYSCVFSL